VKSRRTLFIVIGAIVLLVIAALVVFLLTRPHATVALTPTNSPTSAATATPTPTPTATAASIPADALVVITATAIDTSGAKLAVRMIVHQPVGRDDAAAASDLAQLTSQCGDDPNWAVYMEPESGIERVDVSAVPVGSLAWPTASEVSLWPSSSNLTISGGSGIAPSIHYANTPPLPPCENKPAIYGAAQGTVTATMWARESYGAPVQSPNHYRWEEQEYGFSAANGPDGPVTFSDCTILVTDAAKAYGFDPSIWGQPDDPYDCLGTGVSF
jgi:hypothetical protein